MKIGNYSSESTLAFFTIPGPRPVTAPVVVDCSGRAVTSGDLPASTLAALARSGVTEVPEITFRGLARRSAPALALQPSLPVEFLYPRRSAWQYLPRWQSSPPDRLGVPPAWLSRGITAVPVQTEADTWQCGVNSAARFATMLGQTIPDIKNLRGRPRLTGLAPGLWAQTRGASKITCGNSHVWLDQPLASAVRQPLISN